MNRRYVKGEKKQRNRGGIQTTYISINNVNLQYQA